MFALSEFYLRQPKSAVVSNVYGPLAHHRLKSNLHHGCSVKSESHNESTRNSKDC